MTETVQGSILIALARGAIAEHLGLAPTTPVKGDHWLEETGATFVTLTQQERLRGCIGSLQAHRSLHEDVRANAVAAGFRDPRFSPLTMEEFAYTQVEVSLLSPQEPLAFIDESDALAQMRPGIDGIVLEYGRLRGTFLPQVWEQLPRTEDFIAHLKVKAGLPASFWAEEIRLSRYTVAKWRESDFTETER
ncbi:MAG: AmmeMemoRadiSam system protein A [Methylophilaceae bacterium]|jgi:AmmeMemoRadiSam system protein A|nr:AmmeMemoRadiSam system protein A [Methylophilaceae bacterium]